MRRSRERNNKNNNPRVCLYVRMLVIVSMCWLHRKHFEMEFNMWYKTTAIIIIIIIIIVVVGFLQACIWHE